MRDTKLYIGCLACLIKGWWNSHCDYHHVVEGRKRLGHFFGLGLCLHHHRGEIDNNWQGKTHAEIEDLIGPSLARNKKAFIKTFGQERMLVCVNDFALSLWAANPWPEFCMSLDVGEAIQAEHKKLMEVY